VGQKTLLTVDNNTIYLEQDGDQVRILTSTFGNRPFPNQTIKNLKNLILSNYKIVKDYYKPKMEDVVPKDDLDNICLKIVLDRLHMYNMWRIWYKKQENRNLTFDKKDFDHPDLEDAIMLYLRDKYPADYKMKCELIFSMTADEFEKHEKNRDAFFNI
jgi:hypothetical protein